LFQETKTPASEPYSLALQPCQQRAFVRLARV